MVYGSIHSYTLLLTSFVYITHGHTMHLCYIQCYAEYNTAILLHIILACPVVRLWLHLFLLLSHYLSHEITILGCSARWLAHTPTKTHTMCICTSFLSIHTLYTLSSFYPLLVHTVSFYPLCMHKASFYPTLCTNCLSIQLCTLVAFLSNTHVHRHSFYPVTVRRYSFYPNIVFGLPFLSTHDARVLFLSRHHAWTVLSFATWIERQLCA